MQNIPFGQALEALKNGSKIARSGWAKSYLIFQKGTLKDAILKVKTAAPKDFINPWAANHDDLLATDWNIVE